MIETAPLPVMEIERFAVHDGPGIRSVLFLKGCVLHCPWCANPESQGGKPVLLHDAVRCVGCGACAQVCSNSAIHWQEGQRPLFDRTRCAACGRCVQQCLQSALSISGQSMTAQEIADILLRDRDYYVDSGGGVTLSGGEALLQGEALLPLLRILQQNGVSVAVETCGQFPTAVLEPLLPYLDLFLFDVKHADAAVLRAVTGGDADLIARNLDAIAAAGKQVVARVPVIPGFNHTPQAMEQILRFCIAHGITEVHLLPYHTLGKSKYAKLGLPYTLTAPMLTKAEVQPYAAQAAALGLTAVVGG